jgi:UDP-N-acetylmuramoylalanine--D-glutamate ligase
VNKAERNNHRKYNKVWLGGNIGHQPLLDIIEDICPDDIVVLELSSFQLEQLAKIKKAPHAALLTNLTPNHLDRHGTFENYCAAKENIFKFQTLDQINPSISVFNRTDKIANQWFEKYKNETGRICFDVGPDDVPQDIKSCYPLPGNGNLCNLAQAMAIVKQFGLDDQTIKKHIVDFKSLPHRLELVGSTRGVFWYNDSIATTPESSIEALNAFQQPKIIIAGGYDKHIDFNELGQVIAKKAKAAILIGQCKQKIADAINSSGDGKARVKVLFAETLPDAVNAAGNEAVAGDVVLLSPACASYDMFKNFQQRGEQFAKLVADIS